ncbi:MAG TPA: ligase-associated DNA damage response endonuclease PdeM [Chitinophagaceae bacterium]|nr:ligase-associated DNA damage response endonuclease PdeM [Chitinophagaceae bacterium]
MNAPLRHKIDEDTFWVSPDRILFWENESTVIVSDLHFGKTGHFRKSGIAVPQTVFKEDLQRLMAQLQHFSPSQLLVVGDLFHSVANKELDLFRRWRDDMHGLSIQLVKGNHDILKDQWYADAGIELIRNKKMIQGICFTHDNEHCDNGDDVIRYTISGHLHPGVKVRGLGKQSLCLPCFYFGNEFAILPAFSRFTGTALIDRKPGDAIFAIVDNNIVRLS